MKKLKRLLETQKELRRVKRIDRAIALLIETGALKKLGLMI